MLKNDNILQNYFASLQEHIDSVVNFNKQTKKLLASEKITDLFCLDLGIRAFTGKLGSNKSTNIEKLLVLIKEMATDSTFYLNRLSIYNPILGKLITLIVKDER